MAKKKYYPVDHSVKPGIRQLQAEMKKKRDEHEPKSVVSCEYAGRSTSIVRPADEWRLAMFFQPQIVEQPNRIMGMTYSNPLRKR